MTTLLERLWVDLKRHYKLDSSTSDTWLQLIKTNYGRDNYYNLQYLTDKLEQFQYCREALTDPFSILIALIFQS
jgi:hypothetical protein